MKSLNMLRQRVRDLQFAADLAMFCADASVQAAVRAACVRAALRSAIREYIDRQGV